MENDNTNTYDIIVVGAGPAGSVFVREIAKARPELKILMIDGQQLTSAKPCGGLLAPDAQKLLAKFDLVLPKSILKILKSLPSKQLMLIKNWFDTINDIISIWIDTHLINGCFLSFHRMWMS